MRAMILTATALLAASAANAGEERYRIERQEGGYARIDTRSGAMSFCKEAGGQLVCRLAADERDAYESELARLQTRLDRLEERVGKLETARPAIVGEEGLDQSLDMMEKFVRRFMGVIDGLRKDEGDTRGQLQQKT